MKKLLPSLLCVLIVLFNIMHVYSQIGTGDRIQIDAVLSRKLIVLIEEPNDKMLKKLERFPKMGSVDEYVNDLRIYNGNMKAVAEKFWPYNNGNIQYKTYQEIKELQKSNSKYYVVIACFSASTSSLRYGYIHTKGLDWVKDMKEDFDDRDDKMFSIFSVNTIEDWERIPVYTTPVFDVLPTKSSIVYGISCMEKYITAFKRDNGRPLIEWYTIDAQMKARAPEIAEKILLIREEWLDKDLNAETLKNYYPYKYQICDREMMDNVVMNQDDKYTYGVVLPIVTGSNGNEKAIYLQYIMDGGECQPLALVRPKNKDIIFSNALTGKAGAGNFTSKTIVTIVEQIQGKTIE